ncbi:hypothetical protein HMPREF0970_01281 [Schaalia odontolytica F0309]|uniref:Uncharacterized protein n=1 Tax=Schaalia odontolytica F0309 TaxID=649742 RepID=D4TZA0_9ACTO|nr:hypothetical protein HMPREF0970_01281 [Schaalia odontolytica F0309]
MSLANDVPFMWLDPGINNGFIAVSRRRVRTATASHFSHTMMS